MRARDKANACHLKVLVSPVHPCELVLIDRAPFAVWRLTKEDRNRSSVRCGLAMPANLSPVAGITAGYAFCVKHSVVKVNPAIVDTKEPNFPTDWSDHRRFFAYNLQSRSCDTQAGAGKCIWLEGRLKSAGRAKKILVSVLVSVWFVSSSNFLHPNANISSR